MWSYNYTDELYHYGVPGMRWGHRRTRAVAAREKTAKYLKKDYYKVSDKDAKQFKKDVKYVNRHGRLSDKRRSQVNAKYVDAVMTKVKRDRLVTAIAGTAIVAAGVAYMANRKKINGFVGKVGSAVKNRLVNGG